MVALDAVLNERFSLTIRQQFHYNFIILMTENPDSPCSPILQFSLKRCSKSSDKLFVIYLSKFFPCFFTICNRNSIHLSFLLQIIIITLDHGIANVWHEPIHIFIITHPANPFTNPSCRNITNSPILQKETIM